MTICAIHQPNFFPWMGYFDKIKQADIFIFLDEVAYPKSGSGSGSWCNRVKMLNAGKDSWFGLPIKRESGIQLIKEVSFVNKEYAINKLMKSLEYNYKKSPYYYELLSEIEPLLKYSADNLADYNIHAIRTISQWLGLKTKFIRQSELKHHKHSTELLIELVKQVNADTYLSGNGSAGYQQNELFAESGLELIYQRKRPVENFIKNSDELEHSLSILHFLFCHYESLCSSEESCLG